MKAGYTKESFSCDGARAGKNKAGYTAPDASSVAMSVFSVARVFACVCMFVRVWVFRYPSSLRLCSLINFGRTFVCVCVCACVCVCLCMRVCSLHFVSIAYVENKRFREFEKNGLRTDGRTNGRTDPLIEMRGRI